MIENATNRAGRWIGLVALLALGVGVALAWREWTPAAPPQSPPAAGTPDTSSAVVDDALAQAEESDKDRWVAEVPGVDVSRLGQPERSLFLQIANGRRCTCGCGYTLAACRVYDASCKVSLPRVEAVRDSIQNGWITSASEGGVGL